MALSPMMSHYLQLKEKYKDTIIMYRLGDFYEMFFDDAVTVSRELELTLTGRSCGLDERAPMCGIPYHAAEGYIARLLDKGYKVAICEQVTKPGEQKGLVVRKIVREVTPGTKTDGVMLKEKENNYIVSLYLDDKGLGISWSDITTGEFNNMQVDAQINLHLNEMLSRINPSEIICNEKMLDRSKELSLVKYGGVCKFSQYNEEAFVLSTCTDVIKNSKIPLASFNNKTHCIRSAGALLAYIENTQKQTLMHLATSNMEDESSYVSMDSNARRTLELLETTGGKKSGSLLWLLDKTGTDMGSRMLRQWIEKPLLDEKEINARLDSIETINADPIFRNEIRDILLGIKDIERIGNRSSLGNINPRDCESLASSLTNVILLKSRLQAFSDPLVSKLTSNIDDFDSLADLLNRAITPNPHVNVHDGGVIAEGYNAELDSLRALSRDSKTVLSQLEAKEKAETGIKNLKISYNRVFGYYIEVSKSQVSLVPYRYVRRQTLSTGERYTTEELKDLESKILNAEEKSKDLEESLYNDLVLHIKDNCIAIQRAARSIAYIDCLFDLALISEENGYVKPVINKSLNSIKIIEGRHPIVEKILGSGETFVPNDVYLDDGENRTMLITGPNMAGKSVYMRQVALICIMAQMGCFVPAQKAEICITDKIFTRVGASDDLSTGRSTFMVEMSEVAYIVDNATDNSLLLLDEIGRGTSTYDGLSIAWAIIDYISNNLKAKTLFSTHYHELTELEGKVDGLKNYKLTVREFNNSVIFVRKVMRGSANRSFGIEVASLAGLPPYIITKAKEVLKKLESSDIATREKDKQNSNYQLSIFSTGKQSEVAKIIKEIDVDSITPRNALEILADLKEKLENE
jgi:DNA mismatch repair protein MutS